MVGEFMIYTVDENYRAYHDAIKRSSYMAMFGTNL